MRWISLSQTHHEYTSVSLCPLRALTLILFRFEKNYDPVSVLNWMQQNNYVPVVACFLYYVLIFGGKYLMEEKQPWKWRKTLALWNLGLSAFSWIGMARTSPQLLHNLSTMTLRDNLCRDPQITYGSGSTGLWVQLFILSKFP